MKFLVTLFLFLMLTGCGSAYIQSSNEFFKGQKDRITHDPSNYVKVCTDFFTKPTYSDVLAYEDCSKSDTVAKFLEVRYYSECSLTKPVAVVYQCVAKG